MLVLARSYYTKGHDWPRCCMPWLWCTGTGFVIGSGWYLYVQSKFVSFLRLGAPERSYSTKGFFHKITQTTFNMKPLWNIISCFFNRTIVVINVVSDFFISSHNLKKNRLDQKYGWPYNVGPSSRIVGYDLQNEIHLTTSKSVGIKVSQVRIGRLALLSLLNDLKWVC